MKSAAEIKSLYYEAMARSRADLFATFGLAAAYAGNEWAVLS